MMTWLRRLVPERLGGSRYNIFNAFAGRLEIPDEARPSLIKYFKSRAFWTEVIGLNRAPLWDFVKETKPERILEIGLGNGCNARKMMKLADGCRYYCFDTLYEEESREAYNDLKDEDYVSFFIGDTKRILPLHIKGLPKMDLIFIDGGYDYETVKNDWKCCEKLMHRETACFFHDYHLPSVRKVVDEIGDEYSKKIIKPPKSPPNFTLVMKKRGERSSNNDSNR